MNTKKLQMGGTIFNAMFVRQCKLRVNTTATLKKKNTD